MQVNILIQTPTNSDQQKRVHYYTPSFAISGWFIQNGSSFGFFKIITDKIKKQQSLRTSSHTY